MKKIKKEHIVYDQSDLENHTLDINNVRDGGYAGFALQPDSISRGGLNNENVSLPVISRNFYNIDENIDFSNKSGIEIKKSISNLKRFMSSKAMSNPDIAKDVIAQNELKGVLDDYLIISQNINRALEIVKNDVKFFKLLLKTQKFLRDQKVLNEDLVYFKSTASDDNNSYIIGENENEFNVNEFKNLPSFAARKRYADKHLKKIGAGSARIVYMMNDPSKVLKLAKNKKGIAQNMDEKQMSMHVNWHEDIVAKVYDADQNDLWIISERATKITRSRFKQLTGLDLDDLDTFLQFYKKRSRGERFYRKIDDELIEKYSNDEFVGDITNLVDNWDVEVGDFGSLSSYGEVNRNGNPQIILVDYGLTNNTYSTYYETIQKNIKDGKFNDVDGFLNEDIGGLDRNLANTIAREVANKLKLGNPVYFAEGHFGGYAYDVGNNKILKVTKDLTEANESLHILGKNNERIADIYNVVETNKKNNADEKIFVIVLEKLKTPKTIEDIYNSLDGLLTTNFNQGIASIFIDEYIHNREYWNSELKDILFELLDNHPKEKQFFYVLFEIFSELRKNTIYSFDFLNHKNLGYKKNGKLATFDIGGGDDYIISDNKPQSININEDGSALYKNTHGTVDKGDTAWHLQEEVLNEKIGTLYSFFDKRSDVDIFATKIAENLNKSITKKLNAGTQGVAYELSNKEVLKITTDYTEAQEAFKLRNKKNKHIGNFYNVYKLTGKYENYDIYVIIREYLDVDQIRFEKFFENASHEYDSLFSTGSIKNEMVPKSFDNFFYTSIYAAHNKLKHVHNAIINEGGELKYPHLSQLVNMGLELHKNNVLSFDLYKDTQNVGFKPNGDVAYYDLGYSYNTERSDIPTLDVVETLQEDIIEEDIQTLYGKFGNDSNIDEFAGRVASHEFINRKINKRLDKGSQGIAYLTEGSLVLKITTDLTEVKEAQRFLGKKNQHIGDFYKAYKLEGKYDGIYVIIREYMNIDLSEYNKYLENAKDEYDILYNTASFNENIVNEKSFIDFFTSNYRNKTPDQFKHVYDAIKNEGGEAYYPYLSQFVNMILELHNNGTYPTDIGIIDGHNLGFKPNKNIAYYDLGYSFTTNGINVPTLNIETKTLKEERIKTWMPKAKSVKVKKNCQLGGKGDGTSDACNQGDIKNLEIQEIDDYNKKRRKDNTTNVAEDKKYYVNEALLPTTYMGRFKISDNVLYLNGQEIGVAYISFKKWSDGTFFDVSDIRIDEKHRGNKYFIRFMNALTRYADENNITLSLTPEKLGDSAISTAKLKQIYERFGFIKNSGRNREYRTINTYIRHPQQNESKSIISEAKVKYGCLMAYPNIDNSQWNKLLSKINDDDLYDDGSKTFGKEHEPHVTILYGFHDEVKGKNFTEILDSYKPFSIKTNTISLFETNEKFDVIKFDIEPVDELLELREKVVTFPNTLTYKDYHPHMTIAYVNKGEGKKYVKEFENYLKFEVDKIIYSSVNRTKTEFNLNDNMNETVLSYSEDDFDDENESGLSNEEIYDQAIKIAKDNNIRILSSKELAGYIIEDNKVVAALFESVDNTSYSFDIVVDNTKQRRGFGRELVKYALEQFDYYRDIYGDELKLDVDVVNPNMKDLLNKHFNFRQIEKIGTDRYRMTKESKQITENIMELKDLPIKDAIEQEGGKIYSVGGAVRDEFLGKSSKDLDILITGIPMDKLENLLSQFGKVDAVGKSFGILKFKPKGEVEDIDVAIPRTERATGAGGHKGFEVSSDHNLSIEDDLRRRDFTFNAMAKDINGSLIDPYGGKQDLENGLIKLVNPDAFSDDPLRMIRAISFAARFSGNRVFTIEDETMNAIKKNATRIKEIAGERILEELRKVVDKNGDPLYAADLLRESGLYENIFGAKSPQDKESWWDNEAWNNINTLGEFVFMLIYPIDSDSATLFKTRLKGDTPTEKEIEALQLAWNNVSDDVVKNRFIVFKMNKLSPQTLNSKVLPEQIINASNDLKSNKYPRSFKELAVNGNDLMKMGLKGKEVGDKLLLLLKAVYSDKLLNNKESLLSLNENSDNMKNDKKILYSAVVLDKKSQSKLLERFSDIIPDDWKKIAHHMTIQFGGTPDSVKRDINKVVPLLATEIGISKMAIAVKVEGYESTNDIPHITLAINVNEGGMPVMSNKIEKWKLLDKKIQLKGIVKEYFKN